MNTPEAIAAGENPMVPEDQLPDRWTRTANRVQRRQVQRMHGDPKPNRSRIRRRIHRVKVQHGVWS